MEKEPEVLIGIFDRFPDDTLNFLSAPITWRPASYFDVPGGIALVAGPMPEDERLPLLYL